MATIDAQNNVEESDLRVETCKRCVVLKQERDFQAKKCEHLEKELAELYKSDVAKGELLTRARSEISLLRGIISAFRGSVADDVLQKMDVVEDNSVLGMDCGQVAEAEVDAGEREAEPPKRLKTGKRKPKQKMVPKKEVVTDDDDDDGDDIRDNDNSEKNRACYQLCRWMVLGRDGSVKKCSKVFMLNEMENHIAEVHIGASSSASYTCMWEDCDRNIHPFKFTRGLLRHVRCHALDKKFRCGNKGCGRCFSGRNDLEEHERRDCPFKAVTRKPLKRKHMNAKPKYKCTYEGCDVTFFRKAHVEYHYDKVHVGVDRYKCTLSWCGRVFPTPNLLRKHRLLHTRELPYLCDFPGCEKGFADEEGLDEHRGSHVADVPDEIVELQEDGESAARESV